MFLVVYKHWFAYYPIYNFLFCHQDTRMVNVVFRFFVYFIIGSKDRMQ